MIKPPKLRWSSSRKAQDAGAAAALVAIIALLIIFYLLFIPPSVRDQILEGNGSSVSTGTSVSNKTILLVNPGTLAPMKSTDVEHTIPAVYLYAKESSKVIGTRSTITTSASIFSKKQSSMSFDISDVQNTDNVILTFKSESRRGNLIVKINSKEVFNGQIKSANPSPIKISKSYLVSGVNRIDFSVDNVGWRFWRINKHELNNLQVNADITDKSQQKSKNIFIVSATEKSNTQRSVLRFSPVCTASGNIGKVNVMINTHSVYYAVPDCGGRVAIEFDPNNLRQGENNIVFASEKGNYLMDLIKITSELKKVVQPVYYFQVSQNEISELNNGNYKMYVRLTFVDGTDYKSGSLNINGRESNVYQKEREFNKDIGNYVIKGNNAIKITPKTVMNIVKMEIFKK